MDRRGVVTREFVVQQGAPRIAGCPGVVRQILQRHYPGGYRAFERSGDSAVKRPHSNGEKFGVDDVAGERVPERIPPAAGFVHYDELKAASSLEGGAYLNLGARTCRQQDAEVETASDHGSPHNDGAPTPIQPPDTSEDARPYCIWNEHPTTIPLSIKRRNGGRPYLTVLRALHRHGPFLMLGFAAAGLDSPNSAYC